MVEKVAVLKNMAIKKRDGRKQTYKTSKIKNALFQASKQAKQTYLKTDIEKITYEVNLRIEENNSDNFTTSLIDEYVLDCLYENKMTDLAESYIRRHKEKAKNRKGYTVEEVSCSEYLQNCKHRNW